MWFTLIIAVGSIAISSLITLPIVYDKYIRKKILNPKIKEFEGDLKQRGLLLVEGMFFKSSILINDGVKFLQFAKRKSVKTVFKHVGRDFVNYFCVVNGVIVRTYFLRKVREEK